MEPTRRRRAFTTGVALLAVVVSACSAKDTKPKEGAPKGPPQVGYVVVQASNVAVPVELPGRTVAYQSSDVRPQVAGLITKRLFVEGSIVRQGQPLYLIDPRLYRASVNQASANVAAAQATAEASRLQAERYKPLADIQAVAKQDYTNAVATARQNQAAVAQNRAALDTARINLKFTTVPAPISGRTGRSLFTVGALVTTSQTDPLTTIQQLDPIYVDMQQSAGNLLALRRSLASNDVVPTRAVVRLKLDDGSDYGQTGTVEFSEVVVDQATGTVTLRARFPNARGVLLPGMFVQASFAQAIDEGAILVPQPAVSRDPLGHATLFVVGPGNHAIERKVTAGRTQGADWVITGGLKAGDKVIVQGLATLKPDQVVQPVPASMPQKVQPPRKGAGKGAGADGGTAKAS